MKAVENDHKHVKWDSEANTLPVYRCHAQLHMNSKEVFIIGSTSKFNWTCCVSEEIERKKSIIIAITALLLLRALWQP